MTEKTQNPDMRSHLSALTIIITLVLSSVAFWKFTEEREARHYCEQQLAEMPVTWDVVDTASMQTAFWYTQFPCNMTMLEYPLRPIDGPPTPEMCEEARRILKEREAKRLAPQDRYEHGVGFYDLISCATSGSYELGEKTPGVDTVDKPWRHGSWVLGGECEQLALALQERSPAPMCVGFVKNDSKTAEACRVELVEHLNLLCDRDDLSDDQLRECLTLWHRKKPVKR